MNIKPGRNCIHITTERWNIFVDKFGTYIRLIDGRLIRKLTRKGFNWQDRQWIINDCIDLIEQAKIELNTQIS